MDAFSVFLTVNRCALRTKRAYVGWARRFIREMGAPDAEGFLSSLAVQGRVVRARWRPTRPATASRRRGVDCRTRPAPAGLSTELVEGIKQDMAKRFAPIIGALMMASIAAGLSLCSGARSLADRLVVPDLPHSQSAKLRDQVFEALRVPARKIRFEGGASQTSAAAAPAIRSDQRFDPGKQSVHFAFQPAHRY
jgi:hypothetical protein